MYRSGPLRQWFYRADLPKDPDTFYTCGDNIFLREQIAKAAFKN